MENGAIPDENITASSCAEGITPAMGRLNVGDAWHAGDTEHSYLQVDLGKLHMVCAVASQGNRSPNSNQEFVKKYQVQHSTDGVYWIVYEEPIDKVSYMSDTNSGKAAMLDSDIRLWILL